MIPVAPSAVEELDWLHRFLNCSVFSPPPSEIQRAHQIVDELARRFDEALRRVETLLACSKHEQDRAEAAERKLEEAHIRISNLILNGPDADSRTRRAIDIVIEEAGRAFASGALDWYIDPEAILRKVDE